METFLTKTMTIVALICFLVVGAAATVIIGRDGIPAALPQLAAASVAAVPPPVSNKENKKDRLAVVATRWPPMNAADHRGAERAVAPGLCVDPHVDLGMPREVAPAVAESPAPPQKPKAAPRPNRSRRRATRC